MHLEVEQICSGDGLGGEGAQRLPDETAGDRHAIDLGGGLEFHHGRLLSVTASRCDVVGIVIPFIGRTVHQYR